MNWTIVVVFEKNKKWSIQIIDPAKEEEEGKEGRQEAVGPSHQLFIIFLFFSYLLKTRIC